MLLGEGSRPIARRADHRRWLLLTAALLLAACGAKGSGDPSHPPGEDRIDPATGARRIVVHREDGPVTLVSGGEVPVSLPPGFTLFEGAEVIDNTIAARADGQGVLLVFETEAGIDAVAEHYRAEAEAAGFIVIAALDTEAARTLAATRAIDAATFSLDASQGPPTRVQLSITTGRAP